VLERGGHSPGARPSQELIDAAVFDEAGCDVTVLPVESAGANVVAQGLTNGNPEINGRVFAVDMRDSAGNRGQGS
jgi:hypothetical protein